MVLLAFANHPVGISTGIITEENTIRYQDFDSASTPIGNLGVSSPISYVFSNDVNANTFAKAARQQPHLERIQLRVHMHQMELHITYLDQQLIYFIVVHKQTYLMS